MTGDTGRPERGAQWRQAPPNLLPAPGLTGAPRRKAPPMRDLTRESERYIVHLPPSSKGAKVETHHPEGGLHRLSVKILSSWRGS